MVFLAGDIHTTVAGDVQTQMGAGPPVAVEFAAGSITSPAPGEANYRMPGRTLIPGNDAKPSTPPDVQAHYRAINPWFDALDLDRHGYGIVTASQSALDVTLQRVWTIKERGNIGTMPPAGFAGGCRAGSSIRGTARMSDHRMDTLPAPSGRPSSPSALRARPRPRPLPPAAGSAAPASTP